MKNKFKPANFAEDDMPQLLRCLTCDERFTTDVHTEENLYLNQNGVLKPICPYCGEKE